MQIKITEETLLSLGHIILFGLAFNETNKVLTEIQERHFKEAKSNLYLVRDPLTSYQRADNDIKRIYAQFAIDSEEAFYKKINQVVRDKQDTMINVDETWFIEAAQESLWRYEERHLFWMVESEYENDLIQHLSEDGKNLLLEEVHAYLNKKLVCGNADSSIRKVKNALESMDLSIESPPAPYKEKHNERFAAYYAQLREYFSKEKSN